jgi:hypothetical protein
VGWKGLAWVGEDRQAGGLFCRHGRFSVPILERDGFFGLTCFLLSIPRLATMLPRFKAVQSLTRADAFYWISRITDLDIDHHPR